MLSIESAECLLLLLLLLTANGLIPCASVLQCKTGQYNKIQHTSHRIA
jgi:hypothetical protein